MLISKLPLRMVNVFRTAYEGEGGAGDGGAGDGGGAGEGKGAGTGTGNPPAGQFTQEQVNSFIKKEKQKLITQLEKIQADKKTSDDTRAALEAQLEELRTANMSAEEKTARALKKAQAEADERFNQADQMAKGWQEKHHKLQIGYEISSAFSAADTVPGSLPFVESFLGPRTRLVEVQDEDGKGTGDFKAVVKMMVPNAKDGKLTEVEFSVPEAVKAMKEDVDNFGFIFKSTANAGVGGSSGSAPGKKPNVAKMSTAQYMAERKKNPSALGLKR